MFVVRIQHTFHFSARNKVFITPAKGRMSAFSYAVHSMQSTVQMLQQREVKPMTACPFRNNFLPVPFSHFLFVVGLRVDHLTVCIYIRRCLSSHRKKNKFYVWTSGVSRIECPAVRLFTSLDGRHRYHSHRTDHFIIYFVFFFIESTKPYTDNRAGEKEAMKLEFWCVKPYVEPEYREDEKKTSVGFRLQSESEGN